MQISITDGLFRFRARIRIKQLEDDLHYATSVTRGPETTENIPCPVPKLAQKCNEVFEGPRLRLRIDKQSGKVKSRVKFEVPEEEVSKTAENERLKKDETTDKGWGVFAKHAIKKNSIVCQYKGTKLSKAAGEEREKYYDAIGKQGSYMFFFPMNNEQHCIDATDDDGSLGRLINHSLKRPNLIPRATMVDDTEAIVFTAKDDIKEGEEVLYDYGEKRSSVLKKMPWLKNS